MPAPDRPKGLTSSLALMILFATGSAGAAEPSLSTAGITFDAVASDGYARLTVADDRQVVSQQTFRAGEVPMFEGHLLKDGTYRYELVLSTGQDEKAVSSERIAGLFSVTGGSVMAVVDNVEETREEGGGAGIEDFISGNLSITGNVCLGDAFCTNGLSPPEDLYVAESEANIRIDSTAANGGAGQVWEFENDSATADLQIRDFSASDRVIASFANGAPANSLFLDGSGRIGLGTATPSERLHLATGNIFLDGTSGSWKLTSNGDLNFLLVDNGGGANTNVSVMTLEDDGSPSVGIHSPNPSATLHVRSYNSDGTARILVEELSSTTERREMFSLVNNGTVRFTMTDTSTDAKWEFLTADASQGRTAFNITRTNTGGPEFLVRSDGSTKIGPGGAASFDLDSAGNLALAGALTQQSDVNSKHNLNPVDNTAVLGQIAQLPVMTWQYKADANQAVHVGPTAQDFHAAFGLGADDRHIAPLDAAGVALAGVKALHEQISERDAEIERLNARLEQLEQLMQGIAAK